MTDAVERVARALNPECFDAEVERVYGELWAFDSQAKARRDARAAILALREPTPEMVAATVVQTGYASEADYAIAEKVLDHLPPSEHPDLGDVLAELARDWRSMIDAALQEPSP